MVKNLKDEILGELLTWTTLDKKGIRWFENKKVENLVDKIIDTVLLNEEKIAAEEHKIWASWMKYLFSKCIPHKDDKMYQTGHLIIPKESVVHWKRQINLSYSKLTKREKQSDIDVIYEHHKSLKFLLKKSKPAR